MNPEDVIRKFEQAFNSGSVDALLDLYESNATMMLDTGPVTGADAIREAFLGFLAMKPVIRVQAGDTVRAGDLALTSSRWTLTGVGPDGQPVEMSGHSAEIVRQQPDGTWRYVIDCPFGLP